MSHDRQKETVPANMIVAHVAWGRWSAIVKRSRGVMPESSCHATADKMVRSTLVDATSVRRSFWPGIWLLSLLVPLVLSGPLFGAERIALLIGNTGYAEQVGSLKNPVNDIDVVGKALERIGFSVPADHKLLNGNLAQTIEAVNRYVRRLRDAGDGAIGFFYYSGHGAAYPDTNANYLIPVDVKSAEEDELWDKSIKLQGLIDNLRNHAPNATHFVVFDACRNELTIRRRGAKGAIRPKGFVPEKERNGMLIAYATAAGETAPDDGVYARVLAEELVKKNVEVVSMFRTVQLRVRKETGQEPWLSQSALPELYLAGRGDVIPPRPALSSKPSPAPEDKSKPPIAQAPGIKPKPMELREDFCEGLLTVIKGVKNKFVNWGKRETQTETKSSLSWKPIFDLTGTGDSELRKFKGRKSPYDAAIYEATFYTGYDYPTEQRDVEELMDRIEKCFASARFREEKVRLSSDGWENNKVYCDHYHRFYIGTGVISSGDACTLCIVRGAGKIELHIADYPTL